MQRHLNEQRKSAKINWGAWWWKEKPAGNTYEVRLQLLTLLCCIKTCDWASKSITVRWTNAVVGTKDLTSQFREHCWNAIWSSGSSFLKNFCDWCWVKQCFCWWLLLFLYIFWLIRMVINSILFYLGCLDQTAASESEKWSPSGSAKNCSCPLGAGSRVNLHSLPC